MNYNRLTIWGAVSHLYGTDLDAEFDAIQAVLNGGLELTNFAAGEVESPIIVNAGASRFQTGGLENAELVAAAVAEAVANNIKWVFVPRTLFGYGEDASWSAGIFNAGVALVREGQMMPGHDPVAYGAKPDDATVDDQPAFAVCNTQATGADRAGNPGGYYISVSLPGAYQLDSNVTLSADVGYIEGPGVTLAGTGIITSATTGVTKQGVVPFRGLVNQVKTAAPGPVNIPLSSSNPGVANFGNDMDDWMLVLLELHCDEDTGTDTAKGSGLYGLTVSTTNVDTVIDIVEENGVNTLVGWTQTNNDGGSAHDHEVTLTAYFVKKETLGA